MKQPIAINFIYKCQGTGPENLSRKYNFTPDRHSLTTCTQFCPFLTTYIPLCGHFFALNVDKNRHFLTTYPPLLVNVVIERSPKGMNNSEEECS